MISRMARDDTLRLPASPRRAAAWLRLARCRALRPGGDGNGHGTRATGALPSTGPLCFPADYVEIYRKVRINPARNLHTNQEFRPFYNMRAGEFYRMYFNRSGRQVIDLDAIEFTGQWQPSGPRRYSENEGDRFSAKFRGNCRCLGRTTQPRRRHCRGQD